MALQRVDTAEALPGPFTLGLGTQVRGHINVATGLRGPAAAWMREYVQAVRAVWDCWQNGTR